MHPDRERGGEGSLIAKFIRRNAFRYDNNLTQQELVALSICIQYVRVPTYLLVVV